MTHPVALDLLAINPGHQSAGADTKLTNRGLDKADEMGCDGKHEMANAGAKAKENHRS